ncbi:MAG: quercetin dioxygenase-like cupin family protein [Alphaproteobacteria bacterium]|jgi:quercetin dioxygenase-like cupin family protein
MSVKLEERTAAEAADRPIASYEILIDNDKTIITLFTIKPGEQTGWHRHEFDYVAVQQSTGRLHLDYADGSVLEIDYTPGVALPVSAPVEHNAINVGDVDIITLEIEYKN